jgi:hypothetical protein
VDVVLGVSVTTAAVRMVLIEGEKADGVTVESGTLDTVAVGGAVKASPSEQISAAILATQRNALSNGHHLFATGVTWDDEQALETMRDSVAARDLHNVVLMTEQNAVGALAQTIGRALGYDTTAVMMMNSDTATLSLVDSDDGSNVEVRTCSLNRAKATDFLPAMAASLETRCPRAGGVFVVGSAWWVTSVKSSLERLIPQPVIVPEEPELAIARGAALAAANAPVADASTCGLAYSQDPDEISPVKMGDADTQAAPLDYIRSDDVMCAPPRRADPRVRVRADPRVRMPIGSAAAAALVTGSGLHRSWRGNCAERSCARALRRPICRRNSSWCPVGREATTATTRTRRHPRRDAHNGAAPTRPTVAATGTDFGTRRPDPDTCSVTCDRSTSPGCGRKATPSPARCRRA